MPRQPDDVRSRGQSRHPVAKREPAKTKAELREMLAEAVRSTQPEPKRPPKAKKDRG